MNKALFFSIIIPTFNEEDCLPRLLEDIVEQKEKSFEVIVVDGNSTDKTPEIVKSFASRFHIQFILSQKSNVSYQRNIGAKSAKGKYLVFFDADVQLPKRFLQILKQEILKTPSDYITTYGRADSRIIYDVILARFFNILMDISKFIEKPCVMGFNFIIKKSVFEKSNGFREDVLHGEDFELAERLFRMGFSLKILKHPRIIFSFRRYRQEGRIKVMQKNAKAAIYFLSKGPITREIFDYPMGGAWYKRTFNKPKKKNGFEKLEQYINSLVKSIIE